VSPNVTFPGVGTRIRSSVAVESRMYIVESARRWAGTWSGLIVELVSEYADRADWDSVGDVARE
jgi:hypothetical protein